MPETKLNILVLCYEYPPIGGGGGVGAKQYAEAWAEAGHKVTVLTSWDKGLQRRERLQGVELIRVPTFGKKNRATATNLSMLSYLAFGFVYLTSHFSDFRKIVAINTHFSIPTGPLGMVASKLFALPNVLTIIGGDIYDPTKRHSPHRSAVLRFFNRMIINSATHVVAISSDTKMRAEEHYKIKKEISVINYGFPPPERTNVNRSELGLSEQKYYLIAVGRLVRRKGFEYLIASLRDLPSEIQLLIIGDGPLEQELRSIASRAGVSDRVSLLGYQTRERIWEYLQVSDCYVLSSLHEGLGIVVQEAMCAGLPIVSSDNGGQVDLIHHGRNGVLVKPMDPQALSSAIKEIYSHPEMAAEMRRNNMNDIKRCYIAENCEEYIKLFHLGARGASS
ncbi:MAG: glycosyltransferase family 4 protein [Deltaproteobacteria bacterium]|nr:glycosyltransferase family 4 protein [Deltaproteobacteria bacterium]